MSEFTQKLTTASGARLTNYDTKRKQYPPQTGKTLPDLENIPIGGSRMFHLSVLSVDIRGFTKITMNLGDDGITKLARLQALYLSEISAIIKDNNGVTEKYTGDGVLGLFGTEYDTKANDDVNNAVSCALSIKLLIKNSLNPYLSKNGLPTIGCGMGIDYGSVLIEKVGLRGENQFSLAGKAVSLAAKMQGIAKEGEIFLGDNVRKRLSQERQNYCKSPNLSSGAWVYSYPIFKYDSAWTE